MLKYAGPDEPPHYANIWRQSSNPVTALEEGVDDFESIQAHYEGGCWGGLQRTDRRRKCSNAFLDGSVDHAELSSYPIGLCKIFSDAIPGPPSRTFQGVQLYVSTSFAPHSKLTHSRLKRREFDARDYEWDQGTSKENPTCEHGHPKPECLLCRDELAGRFLIDHHPFMPCVGGHGKRWMFDRRQRAPGRLTFDSCKFFEQLAAAPARSCKRTLWPMPYTPDLAQDSCNGHYTLQYRQDVLFTGYLRHGLPDGFGSLK